MNAGDLAVQDRVASVIAAIRQLTDKIWGAIPGSERPWVPHLASLWQEEAETRVENGQNTSVGFSWRS